MKRESSGVSVPTHLMLVAQVPPLQVWPGPAAIASPGSLLETQNLHPHPGSIEAESAFHQDPQVIHPHLEV